MKTKRILLAVFAIVAFLFSFVSCKDNDDRLEVPYLFRPVAFTANVNKTVATITWSAVEGAKSYTLQISKDSLLFENIIVSDTLTERSFTVELAGATRYSARIKANADNLEKDSKYNDKLTFKTPPENIFDGYSSYMTGNGSASFNWLPAANATHLLFKATGMNDITLPIADNERTAGRKLCDGLANGTYSVGIYNKDVLRGTVKVVIEGDYFVSKGEDLVTVLNSITEGAIVVLKPGTYSLKSTSYNITKGFKIRGLYSDTLSVVCLSGASSGTTMFNINTTSTLSFIRFENVVLSGYLDGGTSGTKINYLFNQSTACAINELSFTNCTIRNFGNSAVRIQQASSVKKIETLTFDNCQIFDIGYASVYAIVNLNVAGSSINNINFKNSSVYNFTGPLILHSTAGSNAVNIENCTFNQITTSGSGTTVRYFVDYSETYSVTSGVIIKKCIFGSSSDKYTDGVRVNSGTSTQVTGSYCTSDYDDSNATKTFSIMGYMTKYSGSSTDLFIAPLTGDFNFKDKTFAGCKTAGDPRWWIK